MLLSIIIPVYNVEKYIGKCLDSLLAQGLQEDEFEIIVVNDGSTDRSQKIAEDYKSKHSNIIILNQKNQGISVARNTGLDIAKGEYIYFIDPDDFLLKNSLLTLLNIAKMYNADILTFKSSIAKEGINDNFTDEECDFNTCSIQCLSGLEADAKGLYPLILTAWFFLVRRDFMNSLGLRFIPEMKNSEDTPVTTPLLLSAQMVVITDANIHRYLLRSESVRNDKSKDKIFKKIEYDIKCACYVNDINIQWKNIRSQNGYKRTQSVINILILFAIIRMLRLNLPTSYIKQKLNLLKQRGLYPIGNISPEFGYKRTKFNLMKLFCNKKTLVLLTSKLLGLKERYEGCSI